MSGAGTRSPFPGDFCLAAPLALQVRRTIKRPSLVGSMRILDPAVRRATNSEILFRAFEGISESPRDAGKHCAIASVFLFLRWGF